MTFIIAIMGKPGTGKTTFAENIKGDYQHDGVVHLQTDDLRQAAFDEPSYSTSETHAVYKALIEFADAAIAQNLVPILDGTFRREAARRMVDQLAEKHDTHVNWYMMECDVSVAKERLANSNSGLSDATPSVYDEMSMDEVKPSRDVTFVDTTPTFTKDRALTKYSADTEAYDTSS